MGRYYHNQFGEEGKFWFAVQPSDDPETVFGATDVTDESDEDGFDESYADYDIDNADYVKKKLDEQYDILGVPQDERRYNVTIDERGSYIWDDLFKYFLTYEKPKDDHIIPYGDFRNGEHITYYAVSREKELAASRINLGLFILSTINRDGYCSLTAEL